jgi:hypothetical protein
MKSITGKYLQSTGSSVPVDIAALYMLREAGLSSDEAAAMMADDRVGLSLGSVVKAMFGLGNDWMEAVENLAGAGYSFTDSISAVFNNHDYHNIIGISILSTLVTKAVTILDDSNKIKNLISIMKMVGKGGFRLSSRIN